MSTSIKLSLILSILLVVFTQCNKEHLVAPYTLKKELGKQIFFSKSLSNPTGQSCASCHAKGMGFSDPNHAIVSPGVVTGLFGNRNAPSVSYAMFSPSLSYNYDDSTYVGGLFLDGRVSSLEEQAEKPFFNPLEMNITDLDMFVEKVKQSEFYNDYVAIYGSDNDKQQVLKNITEAIATYERSSEVSPFSSKFDYYLKGEATLTPQEKQGMDLFKGKALCANCHIIDPDEDAGRVLFTDFTYDNIGVPKNPSNPFYSVPSVYNPDSSLFVDLGLAGTTNSSENNGQFKVPTLRNVAFTAPYFHNGFFTTLEEVVHFYNSRDVETFPAPEVSGNVNQQELGNLGLSAQEEAAVVSFLNTLSDGYK